MGDDFNEHFSKYYDYIYASKDFKTSLLDYFSFIGLKGRKNVQILDVGCGTGQHSLVCVDEGFNVVSVDPSIHMLNIFNEKIKSIQLKSQCSIICANGQDLPIRKKFDSIICLWSVIGYMNEDELKTFFLNSFNSLNKGDFLYINFWNKDHIFEHGVKNTYYEFTGPDNERFSREAYSKVILDYVEIKFVFKGINCKINPDNMSTSTHQMRFYSIEYISDLLLQAGFSNIFIYDNSSILDFMQNKKVITHSKDLNLKDIYELNLFIQS
jgi:SAM-dependent methyltransferase